jgi:AcrR family transcriptional regulator
MHGSDGHEIWIEAALRQLGKGGGVDGVRVEVLAKNLGVTKGGFYRRFRDRQQLLDAVLETWAQGRIASIERQGELGNASARERLKSLIKLYSERVNPEGMAIELAIRQWARSYPGAGAAAARVDAARVRIVESLYGKLGLSSADAQAQAVLFYSFIFGQSLLFLEQGPRKRASLIDACADTLITIDRR